MLTKQQALSEHEFHFGQCSREDGPRGGVKIHCVRARRNGMTQTWKTRPDEWSVPVKYGIRARDQFRLTQADASKWHAASECSLRRLEPSLDEVVQAERDAFPASFDSDGNYLEEVPNA